MTDPTDAELWHRIRANDPEAFGDLYGRHGPTIHRFALRRTGDPHHADDVTATVFLEAWRRRHRTELHQPTALPWLYGVTTNVLHNWRRSRRRHDAALDRLRSRIDPGPALTDQQAEAADEARRVLARLPRLPAGELDVLVLATWEGLSIAEIADALDLPAGTVKSRLHRARQRLAATEPDPAPTHGTTPMPTPGSTPAVTSTLSIAAAPLAVRKDLA